MTKTIDTLIEDMHKVFSDPSHKVDPKNLELFGKNSMEALQNSVEEASRPRSTNLRMSKIGTPDRKLWYEMNTPAPAGGTPPLDPSLLMKFLYGHLLEELVLFFARESGHLVEGEQDECDIGGVKGHRDCKIDNVVVDVKSASNFGFKKFQNRGLFKDDPFGYIPQISSYVQADKEAEDYGAFLTINKESGELTLLRVDPIDMLDAPALVEHKKKVAVATEVPTAKCYPVRPQVKDPAKDNGNRLLHWNCGYCKFKDECWKDANGGDGIRRFKYANKVEEFVEVVKKPLVEEIV